MFRPTSNPPPRSNTPGRVKSDWSWSDLIRARDGSLSLTKLGASSFHLSLFLVVNATSAIRIAKYWGSTAPDPALFDMAMWTLYAGVAVGHAVVDKQAANFKDFKERKIELEAGAAPKDSEPLPNP